MSGPRRQERANAETRGRGEARPPGGSELPDESMGRAGDGATSDGQKTTLAHGPRPALGAHETRLRVRYRDTDAMGVVYYANYLAFFEAARVELLRDLGIDYRALEEQGMAAPVSEASCRYRLPARFDDLLIIRTRVADVRRASFAFEYEVVREADGALVAHGRTAHACVRLDTLRPVPLPGEIREKLASVIPHNHPL